MFPCLHLKNFSNILKPFRKHIYFDPKEYDKRFRIGKLACVRISFPCSLLHDESKLFLTNYNIHIKLSQSSQKFHKKIRAMDGATIWPISPNAFGAKWTLAARMAGATFVESLEGQTPYVRGVSRVRAFTQSADFA